jgi:hypothetical protein
MKFGKGILYSEHQVPDNQTFEIHIFEGTFYKDKKHGEAEMQIINCRTESTIVQKY